jgi:phage repressor protein C with HTH and peptisase S24 domain
VTKNDTSNDKIITINQYVGVLGSMGTGIILRDESGQIIQWRVNEEWINKNIPQYSKIHNLKIVTGFGDSMRGIFRSGDPLIVDTGINALEGDAVYFFRVGNEGFIKTLQRVPGIGIRVISENKKYETWTILENMDFEVIGRVLKTWESKDF